ARRDIRAADAPAAGRPALPAPGRWPARLPAAPSPAVGIALAALPGRCWPAGAAGWPPPARSPAAPVPAAAPAARPAAPAPRPARRPATGPGHAATGTVALPAAPARPGPVVPAGAFAARATAPVPPGPPCSPAARRR